VHGLPEPGHLARLDAFGRQLGGAALQGFPELDQVEQAPGMQRGLELGHRDIGHREVAADEGPAAVLHVQIPHYGQRVQRFPHR